MKFMTKDEISVLSESQKSEYYTFLNKCMLDAHTVSEYEALIIEFEKLNYLDSDIIVTELRLLADKQKKVDFKESLKKVLKIALISLSVICCAVLVAVAIKIFKMF